MTGRSMFDIQFNPQDCYSGRKSRHPIYLVYIGMVRRCGNPNTKDFKYYGAKGVRLCDEWLASYKSFYDWAFPKYAPGLSIERADTRGNYGPDNCTWIPKAEQPINRGIFSNNTSGFKGVSFMPRIGRFKAYIGANKKVIYLGVYKTAEAAAAAYDEYVIANGLMHPLNLPQSR